ncbi:MAG: mitochondrial fission ELM1 family protein [Robiginitomaculum sp.]|nr:mitochondrial fission ELM1 family protein [Robiginitomaculum sp.]
MPEPDENTALTCLVVSDGRRGIENQALGLAEALSRLCETQIAKHVVTAGRGFKVLPPRLQFILKPAPQDYGITDVPKIAIGCGRQAIAPLLALKKKHGADIFTVYVQDPRINPKYFDLVIAPQHDGLSGGNVETMIGSPNRITPELLQDDVIKFQMQLAKLPCPRVAVLIGGTSKSHKLTPGIHKKHMKAICALAEQGMSVMLTTSRRTPDWAVEDYRKITADRKRVWVWDNKGENPYFAFLGAADAVLVTEDSTNMLTEACATGKPVFTLSMAGNAGKFAELYASLEKRCHVLPFAGLIESDNSDNYEPLCETSRVAKTLLERL